MTINQQSQAPSAPDKLFAKAMYFLKMNDMPGTMHFLKEALQHRPMDPHYLSYLGLCMARLDPAKTEAVILCEQAAEEVCYDAQLYLNLGKVHLLLGDRRKARVAYTRGLELDGDNSHLRREIKAMGVRKAPVFPFLERSNPLNRFSGLLCARLGLR